jgi:hypothetical protein
VWTCLSLFVRFPAFEELIQSNRAIRAAEEAASRRTVSVGSASSEEPPVDAAVDDGADEPPQLEEAVDSPAAAPAILQPRAFVTELDGLD